MCLCFSGSWPRCHVNWWCQRKIVRTRESCSSTWSCRRWPPRLLSREGEAGPRIRFILHTDPAHGAAFHPLLFTLCVPLRLNEFRRPVEAENHLWDFVLPADSRSCRWSWTDSWRDAWGTPSALIQSPCVWCLERRWCTWRDTHFLSWNTTLAVKLLTSQLRREGQAFFKCIFLKLLTF